MDSVIQPLNNWGQEVNVFFRKSAICGASHFSSIQVRSPVCAFGIDRVKFNFIKNSSMLPCVCTVIDQR